METPSEGRARLRARVRIPAMSVEVCRIAGPHLANELDDWSSGLIDLYGVSYRLRWLDGETSAQKLHDFLDAIGT